MRTRAALLFTTATATATATAAAIATLAGCATDPSETDRLVPDDEVQEQAICPAPAPVVIDRSLFVSPTLAVEQAELRSRFSVAKIMKHILTSSGATAPADGTALWQRWWDSQNKAPGVFPDTPHCDDNGTTVNGFPVFCPRNEGALATSVPDSHFPIALVFRPDLAPRDGSTCGEARVVIAKPADASGRNLAIFEASIPNPSPGCGLAGCRKIAEFWAKLSANNSFSSRMDALERFYFQGLNLAQDGVVTAPALDAANLGLPNSSGASNGQIRSNQFMTGPNQQLWQLREFKLAKRCTLTTGCKLFFQPVSDKTNPFGTLFNDNNPQPLGPAFRTEFLDQVKPLSPQDVNQIGMTTSNQFNAGQSNSSGSENLYPFHFSQGNPAGFALDITNKLGSLGIPVLTANDIVARATTQACAGCHQLSNNVLLGGLDANGNPLQ